MNEISMGESSSYRVSKKELIEIINNNFVDSDFCDIAVITQTKSRENEEIHLMQSVTFAKMLKY